MQQHIIDMSLHASGVRDTARVLRISPDTVLNELKKMERFIRFYQEVFDAQVVHDNRHHAGHVGERMVDLQE